MLKFRVTKNGFMLYLFVFGAIVAYVLYAGLSLYTLSKPDGCPGWAWGQVQLSGPLLAYRFFNPLGSPLEEEVRLCSIVVKSYYKWTIPLRFPS